MFFKRHLQNKALIILQYGVWYSPIVSELLLFVNPNRVCIYRDNANQVSHTTDFVINNLVYSSFIRQKH